ncbi:hypothetical protein [Pseudomonas sp. MWU13-3659]|uniref:hypothetical protein n=1 Tax=Pseudomonas sp. MWU13-3659 TaxID=2986964 RepID=UPI00207530E9|nr:hypothetical protein [Pseudomonas sp. MWU13-3659]
MSNTHDQAMHYVYQQVLQRLFEHMNQAQRASVQLLIQRLLVVAGGQEHVGRFQLMVLHGADRRSARLLACLRAAQLSISLRYVDTFRLRVLVARHPTLDDSTLASHERCFSALFLHDDPRVELLRSDSGQIGRFGARPSCSSEQRAASGKAWLLFGHLTGGQPEAVLGARAYLELAAGLGNALAMPGDVDALVTVVPASQRRRLLAWSRHCLRQLIEAGYSAPGNDIDALAGGLTRLGLLLADPFEAPTPRTQDGGGQGLRVVTVEDVLQHLDDSGPLDQMLGRQDALPCMAQGPAGLFDPLPLAHLHGLRAQHVEARGYGEGARAFFRRLEPGQVAWPQGQALREEAQARLFDAYGVGEDQLVCQLFSPFEARGRNLEAFVQRCHPGMRVALPYLHQALQGRPCPEPVRQWLIDTSGLELTQLRSLYAGQPGATIQRLLLMLGRRDRWLRAMQVSGVSMAPQSGVRAIPDATDRPAAPPGPRVSAADGPSGPCLR